MIRILVAFLAFLSSGQLVVAQEVDVPPGHGVQAVLRFYELLLQEAPPTVEEESEVFSNKGGAVRARLEADGKREEPVTFNYLRENRHLFVPPGGPDERNNVHVSSFFSFPRTLTDVKDNDGKTGCVIAIFGVKGENGGHDRLRAIFFIVERDGKLSASAICFDRFDGPALPVLEEMNGEAQ